MGADSNEKTYEGVDKKKAASIIKWLVEAEDKNLKTGEYKDPQMVQRIGKRIQEDVKCL